MKLSRTKSLQFLNQLVEEQQSVKKAVNDVPAEADIIFHQPSHSAQESAENSDLEVENIIKTIVLKTSSQQMVAALTPGNRKVSLDKMSEHEPGCELAEPEEIQRKTGFQVGGVSPFGHDLKTYIDQSILGKNKVRASAGSQCVGVLIEPQALKNSTSARPADFTSKI